ncbi:hypothetical protein GCM10007938_07910 [Vibrio zhanjiangensis]|uniref:LuxR family transcriptional regulator n=1 Tax=Vibrio zhanjiangensis TaxID=1046128 RepID=A0ABQ6EW39_9VIBR|nr:hypothetical protein [Vibrio zhanjiangensis]GLT17014.1 hypothetical protein GCM10007938_07910 [Vibrio zhanjiangensis]
MRKNISKHSIEEVVEILSDFENVSAHPEGRKILVTVDNTQDYYLWPYGKQWCHLRKEEELDRFYGEAEWFIERYIKKSDHCPKYSGKTWNKIENEEILAMCNEGFTITQISESMFRHPSAVAMQLEKLGVFHIRHDFRFWEVLYDIPIIEILAFTEPYRGPNTTQA